METNQTLAEKLSKPMPAEELRALLLAAKEEGRAQRASRPIAEKLEALERMREIAGPIRAARLRAEAAKAKK